ncbi:MAG: CoA transferase, partial [Gemmataceae bacterium]
QAEQIKTRRMCVGVRDPQGRPVHLLGSPLHLNGHTPPVAYPPALGQHSEEILRELADLAEGEIAELRNKGVM